MNMSTTLHDRLHAQTKTKWIPWVCFIFGCLFYLVWFEYFLPFCCYLFVLIFVQFFTEREKEQETGWVGRLGRYGRSWEGEEYNLNIFFIKK